MPTYLKYKYIFFFNSISGRIQSQIRILLPAPHTEIQRTCSTHLCIEIETDGLGSAGGGEEGFRAHGRVCVHCAGTDQTFNSYQL